MNHAKNLWQRLQAVPKITEMFPLLYIADDWFIPAKNGAYIAVMELEGVDYTGMSQDMYDNLYNVRKRLFEKDSPFYEIGIVSKKTLTSADEKIKVEDDNNVIHMIKKAWSKNFTKIHRTSHYIVITVNNSGLFNKVGAMVDHEFNIDKESELTRIVTEIQAELSTYQPRLLQGALLSSFYASQLNGRDTFIDAKHWDQPISNQPISFDAKTNYCTYGNHEETIYSAWLSISRYSEEVNNRTLERLYKLPYCFTVYQTIKPLTALQTHALFKEEQEELEFSNKGKKQDNNGGRQLEEPPHLKGFTELKRKVESDQCSMVTHRFALEVTATSLDKLKHDVLAIKNALTSDGKMSLYHESRNLEALFWSRFPTMGDYNERARKLTSENAAHLVSFNRVGEGFDRCGFGDRPVTLFKNEEGGQYSFNFHATASEKPDTLGHTVIFGDTGAGKTTLISFLILNCLNYKDFQAVCFDRHKGLNVFTEMMGGDYLDIPCDVKMNPFQMDDTPPNRMFLDGWLRRLGNITDNEHDSKIRDLIENNFMLERHQRSFEALEPTFGIRGNSFRARFEQWFTGQTKGMFFNGERDSFNFDKKIVTFDATYILDEPEILPHVTDYAFHQIRSQVSKKATPHILFFDESRRYFQEWSFGKRMLEMVNEERKLGGVVVLAAQKVSQYKKLPNDIGAEVVGAMAHIICYPDPTADKEDYCDFLGFNEQEFKWIKDTPKTERKVIVKNRNTGSSVVIDVDLSILNTGQYQLTNALDSSSDAVLRMQEMKKSHPNHWQTRFLLK